MSTYGEGARNGGPDERRSRGRSSSWNAMSMSEFIKLSVSGILTGIILVQLFDMFFVPTSIDLGVGSGSSNEGPGTDATTYTPFNTEKTTFVPSGSPTHNPTSRPTPSPTLACMTDLPGASDAPESLYKPDTASLEPKVYILQDQVGLNTAPLIECLLEMLRVPPSKDGRQTLDVEAITAAAFASKSRRLTFALTDMLLLDGLKRHPWRTFDIAEADLVIPEMLPGVSTEMPPIQLLREFCPKLAKLSPGHVDRMVMARESLHKSAHWSKEWNRKKYVFIHSRPLGQVGTEESFLKPLMNDIVKGKSMVLTGSASFAKRWFKRMPKKAFKRFDLRAGLSRIVTVPLLPNVQTVSEHEFGAASAMKGFAFYFEDTFSNSKILDRIESLAFTLSLVRAEQAPSGLLDKRVASAFSMRRSRACLVLDFLPGEVSALGLQTLYDAIQAGCLPVFLLDKPLRLPLASQLDWKQVGLHTLGLTCLSQHWLDLQALKEKVASSEFVSQQASVLAAWKKLFQFPTNIVDARLLNAAAAAPGAVAIGEPLSSNGTAAANGLDGGGQSAAAEPGARRAMQAAAGDDNADDAYSADGKGGDGKAADGKAANSKVRGGNVRGNNGVDNDNDNDDDNDDEDEDDEDDDDVNSEDAAPELGSDAGVEGVWAHPPKLEAGEPGLELLSALLRDLVVMRDLVVPRNSGN